MIEKKNFYNKPLTYLDFLVTLCVTAVSFALVFYLESKDYKWLSVILFFVLWVVFSCIECFILQKKDDEESENE